jgi:hypothetical protein
MWRMIRKSECCVLLCLLLLAPIAKPQSTSIHEQIQQVYSFQPHLLKGPELEQKSAILDEFWKQAKAQQTTYISSLRLELADFRNPPFFLYDGSLLLLSLSDTHEDHQIALAAIAHCDLRDVQQKSYFWQVHRLAALGEDTTAPALRVLEDPGFNVIVPEHALTLGQDYVLVYLLLPTDDQYWLRSAIERIGVEKDETAQKSLLVLLWYAQDNAADKAIAAFASDTAKPEANRKIAQQFAQRKGVGVKVAGEIASLGSSEGSLRKKRRERMKSVSDETLIDLDRYTLALAAKRK